MRVNPHLLACATACFECAQACALCVDSCLGEVNIVALRRCLRLTLDCGDICQTTSRMLMRQFEPNWSLTQRQLEICAKACRVCAEECDRLCGKHQGCLAAAEACRRCEQECQRALQLLPA